MSQKTTSLAGGTLQTPQMTRTVLDREYAADPWICVLN
jgi:hypothetical protein